MRLKDQSYLSVNQVSAIYLVIIFCMLFSSTLLAPRIGFGNNLLVNEIFLILLPTFIVARSTKTSWKKIAGFKKTSFPVLFAAFWAGVGIWLIDVFLATHVDKFLINRFGTFGGLDAASETNVLSVEMWPYLLGALILAPIFEEIFFRGMVQGVFARYNLKWSWVVVGFLFGGVHFLNQISNGLANILHGLVLGYVVYRTGSVWVSMVLHGANNGMAIFFGTKLVVNNPAALNSPVTLLMGGALLFLALKGMIQLTNPAQAWGIDVDGEEQSVGDEICHRGSTSGQEADLEIADCVEETYFAQEPTLDVLGLDADQADLMEPIANQDHKMQQDPPQPKVEIPKPKMDIITFITLSLAVFIFLGVAALEVAFRSQSIPVNTQESQKEARNVDRSIPIPLDAKTATNRLDGKLIGCTYEFNSPADFDFSYTLEGEKMDLKLIFRNPKGKIIFERVHQGSGLFTQPDLYMNLETTGEYLVELDGTGENIELNCSLIYYK